MHRPRKTNSVHSGVRSPASQEGIDRILIEAQEQECLRKNPGEEYNYILVEKWRAEQLYQHGVKEKAVSASKRKPEAIATRVANKKFSSSQTSLKRKARSSSSQVSEAVDSESDA